MILALGAKAVLSMLLVNVVEFCKLLGYRLRL